MIAEKISSFNRARKMKLFLKYINPLPGERILDIGFTEKEYSPVDNYLEKHYPYQENITALGINKPKDFLKRYPKIKCIQYDGLIFPFEDKSFDICWSNAVIEHVGNYDKQVNFLKEIKRVGKKAFITTPNRLFPVEVHTRTPIIHYLPKPIFDKYLSIIGKTWATEDYMHLLSLSKIKQLLAQADINSYKIIKNKLGINTLDFVIMF